MFCLLIRKMEMNSGYPLYAIKDTQIACTYYYMIKLKPHKAYL
jgi:hypothetical protein